MEKSSPIKRDQRLIWLSRDHHDGLLIVWKIRQGLRQGIDVRRIIDYVLHAFAADLEPHFKEEEVLLFPNLDPKDDLRVRAEAEHAALRETIRKCKSFAADNVALLQEFAAMLDAHIRFEERKLFPHVEQVVPMEILNEVGRQLEADHKNKPALEWPDAFWLKA
jgi:hemerythrin-like domain-containing protein